MLNIGIIGEVSVGKSTLVNALVSKYLSTTSLKRTTYVPFLFKNSLEEDDNKTIQQTIQDANKNKEHYKSPIKFKTQISFSDIIILV
jgi:GTPase SAR1 family protein